MTQVEQGERQAVEVQNLVGDYEPNQSAIESLFAGKRAIILVGVTGAGKDTVRSRMFELYPDEYGDSVSHTTRKPRVNDGIPEEDGLHYYFVDLQTIQYMVESEEFFEIKKVHDNYYGTSLRAIETAMHDGRTLLADVDVAGAEEFLDRVPDRSEIIFVVPPDAEEWLRRLSNRGDDLTGKELRTRLESALFEIGWALDNESAIKVIINDDLDKTVSTIRRENKAGQWEKKVALETLRTLQEEVRRMYSALDWSFQTEPSSQ